MVTSFDTDPHAAHAPAEISAACAVRNIHAKHTLYDLQLSVIDTRVVLEDDFAVLLMFFKDGG
jgi:hypothetical protein